MSHRLPDGGAKGMAKRALARVMSHPGTRITPGVVEPTAPGRPMTAHGDVTIRSPHHAPLPGSMGPTELRGHRVQRLRYELWPTVGRIFLWRVGEGYEPHTWGEPRDETYLHPRLVDDTNLRELRQAILQLYGRNQYGDPLRTPHGSPPAPHWPGPVQGRADEPRRPQRLPAGAPGGHRPPGAATEVREGQPL